MTSAGLFYLEPDSKQIFPPASFPNLNKKGHKKKSIHTFCHVHSNIWLKGFDLPLAFSDQEHSKKAHRASSENYKEQRHI